MSTVNCAHLADLPDPGGFVIPDLAAGCPACVADGLRDWVHLRLCLTCGTVSCCDSSPARHATKHFHATGHPVMRSIEPGESWRWCFADQRLV